MRSESGNFGRFLPFIAVLATILGTSSYAQVQPVNPAEIQAVTTILSGYVHTFDQAFYVYNWSNAEGRDSVWKTALSATSSAGLIHLQSGTERYWDSFCSRNPSLNPPECASVDVNEIKNGGSNVYGPGLYFALDPVATIEYGNGPGWVLMQLRMHKGMRYLDLRGASEFPPQLLDKLESIGCPKKWNSYPPGMSAIVAANATYLSGGDIYVGGVQVKFDVPDQCLLSLRQVLQGLNVDALFYDYSATEFKECSGPGREAALLITNADHFTADDVRVFNAQTPDDKAERVRIQSLFYEADVDLPQYKYMKAFRNAKFPNYPNHHFSGLGSSCFDFSDRSTCKTQINLCPDDGNGGCTMIDAPYIPAPLVMPKTMTNGEPSMKQNEFLLFSNTQQQPMTLLWPDLDGVAPDANLSAWIGQNMYGCKPSGNSNGQ